jgi:hypothetical protein
VIRAPGITATFEKPRSVGYVSNVWGEAAVRREVEQILSRIEDDGAFALHVLPERWPFDPGSREWKGLLTLCALHVLRPAFARGAFRTLQLSLLQSRSYEASFSSEEGVEDFYRAVTSDRFLAELVIGEVPKVASLLGSMHQSLVEFGEPVLATSDGPVVAIPDTRMPAGGLLGCVEMRVAVAPTLALIFTWVDEPQPTRRLRGGPKLAAHLNSAVIGQAAAEWYYHPERRPSSLIIPSLEIAPIVPVSPHVLDGYDVAAAARSRRYAEATAILDQLIEDQVTDEIRVVGVRAGAH